MLFTISDITRKPSPIYTPLWSASLPALCGFVSRSGCAVPRVFIENTASVLRKNRVFEMRIQPRIADSLRLAATHTQFWVHAGVPVFKQQSVHFDYSDNVQRRQNTTLFSSLLHFIRLRNSLPFCVEILLPSRRGLGSKSSLQALALSPRYATNSQRRLGRHR